MSTTTDLTTLKFNYLTQEQYEEALEQGLINENEFYLTPAQATVYTAGTLIDITNNIISVDGPTLLDIVYPVGSYYETSDTLFDPNVSWGGTWVKDSAGKVTVAQDTADTDFDVVGETGGSKNIQAHTHNFTQPTITSAFLDNVKYTTGGSSPRPSTNGTKTTTGWNRASGGAVGAVSGASTGNAGNLQPYIVVNRWHRTA